MVPGGKQAKRKRSIPSTQDVPGASTGLLWSSLARQQLVPEQFSPSAENNSGGENVVQKELTIVADNTSYHEDFNNPDGGNGVNEAETGWNSDFGQTGSSSEGWLLCFTQVF